MPAPDKSPLFKAGYVTITGKPNVGKSTLMNAFLKQKLAIVTPKPQTTRNRILGICNENDYQIIFLDTPGIIKPRYKLQEAMVKAATVSLKEADLILFMVEPDKLAEEDENLLKTLEKINTHKFLIINKVDLVSKKTVLPLMDKMNQTGLFKEIIPVSALKSDGLDLLLKHILEYLPAGEPFYPPDMISDEPERFFVAEIIREKIFFQYSEEIPYATAVSIEEFIERQGKKDYIRASICVERESQKGILIGKKGHALKKVGKTARDEIETFLGRPVYLELEVRVKKKWRQNTSLMKNLGY